VGPPRVGPSMKNVNIAKERASDHLHVLRTRAKLSRMGLSSASIQRYVSEVLGDDLHAKRILSLANATLGVLHATSLCLHFIGRAYAQASGTDAKHGVKQIDRLLSNDKIRPWHLAPQWIATLVGPREDVGIALDWTEFDGDDHSTLVASLLTKHGRATPLLWRSVKKSELAGQRNQHEDELLEHLRDSMPEGVQVTILADRGFGDQERYRKITELGMHYVIRFREGITVTDQWGNRKPAADWVKANGHAVMHKDVAVTEDMYVVPAVVLARDKGMQEAWCLATSRTDKTAAEIVKLYGKRFSIEETFRDVKNSHLGMGLSATHIGAADRRDRLILIAAMAHTLLTLLGEAGERCGLDRTLKSNTSKRRQLSLYNQGIHWYMAIPNMREERLQMLIEAYGQVLAERAFTRDFFGVL
jgi:hypothetical protein